MCKWCEIKESLKNGRKIHILVKAESGKYVSEYSEMLYDTTLMLLEDKCKCSAGDI